VFASTVDETVIGLVRVALGLTDPTGSVPVDECALERSWELGVLEQILAAGATVGFTAQAAPMAAKAARAGALRGVEAEAMAWRVHRVLGDAGVASLALKGVAVAAMTNRRAADRAGVDTDVLIRPHDWPAAHQALVGAGYRLNDRAVVTPLDSDSLTRLTTFTCNEAAYLGPGGAIDLHWRLGPGHLASLSTPTLLERAVTVSMGGEPVPALDPDASLAHIALHGAKDRWRSVRTLVDAYLLVTIAGATWDGATALVGRSAVVADAKWAVEAVILNAHPHERITFGATPDEALPAYIVRRTTLVPSVASAAAVVTKALLPPQLLASSTIPRRVWWLMIGPRIGRAAWSGGCALVAAAGHVGGRR
jgi:hypothetical protein